MQINEEGKLADWNLIVQGNISLLWIQECLKPENQNKKVNELLREFLNKNENINLLNPSVLLMASYLLFVYTKEKDFNDGEYSFVDISKFNVIASRKRRPDGNYICRRVRNALAHSRVHIDESLQITFEDSKPDGTDYFKCVISCVDFGNFINNFMFTLKDSYFSNRV
ncbi:TPA: hypothetical protein QCU39_000114 [Bacillus cereus]|nr:hypothetical protein [Bacillus cereus]